MEHPDLDTMRTEAQVLAGAGISALLPKLIEDAIHTDDPELRVKIFTSLRPISGMDAPKPQTASESGAKLEIRFILKGVEPIEAMTMMPPPTLPHTEVERINEDVEGAADAGADV